MPTARSTSGATAGDPSGAWWKFCRRHPEWPDNLERDRVNGPLRIGREPAIASARKLVKGLLSAPAVTSVLFGIARVLESSAPEGRLLDRIYRVLLGAHIFRGYRKGLRKGAAAPPAPVPSRAEARGES
jgi:hypothetical protein